MRSPRWTSRGSAVNVVFTRVESPNTRAVVMTKRWPVRSSTGPPPANGPVRIFGPWRSARIAIGFWCLMAAARSIEMLFACSSCVPCEKLSRATSIPASSKRSIIRGERLAGPMVQTIFEWRKFMLLMPASVPARSYYLLLRFLTSDRKFGDDPRQHVDSFVERRQRYSLILSVHSFQIFFRQWKWNQPIRLHVVQSQLGGIRRPRGLKRQHNRAREFLRCDFRNHSVKIRLQRRRRRCEPAIRFDLELHQRIVHQFCQIANNLLDRVSGQQPDIQIRMRFPRYHVVRHARRQDRGRNRISQHGVPERARVRKHSLRVFASV